MIEKCVLALTITAIGIVATATTIVAVKYVKKHRRKKQIRACVHKKAHA